MPVCNSAGKLPEPPREAPRVLRPASDAYRHSGGGGSVIDAVNQHVGIREVLLRNGYTDCRDGRLIRPGGRSESVTILDSDDGIQRSFHHSASDPLHGLHAHDAFSASCVLEFGGDAKRAVKAWAERLGLGGQNGHAKARTATAAAPLPEGDTDTEESRPSVRSFDMIEPQDIEWHIQNKLARGVLTALGSVPGLGKTFVTCDIAARTTTGSPMPDGSPVPLGDTLFCNLEDDPNRVLRPRLTAAGADVARVHLLDGIICRGEKRLFSLHHAAMLRKALEALPDPRLLIVDPIGSFIPGIDSNKDNEVRSLLTPLAVIAADFNLACLLVMHRRKAQSSLADDGVLGSRAFTGIVRTVWHILRDPNDRGRRMLLAGKHNLGIEPTGLGFSIQGAGGEARVMWEREPLRFSADEAMAAASGDYGPESRAPVLEQACDWLRELLTAGPLEVTKVEAEAKAAGVAAATLRRARETVCRRPFRGQFGGVWMWSLKPAMTPPSDHSDPLGLNVACASSPDG